MILRIEGELGCERVWCPECGKEMDGDLHSLYERWGGLTDEQANALRDDKETQKKYMRMDDWTCFNSSAHKDHDIVEISRNEDLSIG
jgi:hypothetical protein